MKKIVIDASVALAWCFKDEATVYTDNLLQQIDETWVHVPLLWLLEVGNVLQLAERKDRITSAGVIEALSFLESLDFMIDHQSSFSYGQKIVFLARENNLTTYDATYLELAMRLDCPLATFDKQLIKAAHNTGVEQWGIENIKQHKNN